MKKRLLSRLALLSLALLLGAMGAAATGEPIVPYYEEISSLNISLTLDSGKASVTGEFSGTSVDTHSKLTVTLQKSALGATAWEKVTAWSDSASGRRIAGVYETYPVERGYDYRARAVGKILNSEDTVLESEKVYSKVRSYR